jgi:predicted transcriptional regulator
MAVPRKRSPSLTPLELKIMQALWEVGPANVKVVQRALRPTSVLAYTSVQTVLNILQRKGKTERKLEGRAYLYRAVVSREKVTVAMLQDMIHRMFGGSADQLVVTLIESNLADPARVCELAREFAGKRAKY